MNKAQFGTKAQLTVPTVLIRIIVVLFKKAFPEWQLAQKAHLAYLKEFLVIRNDQRLAEAEVSLLSTKSKISHMQKMIAITNGERHHDWMSNDVAEETPLTIPSETKTTREEQLCEYRNCDRTLIMAGRSDKRFCNEAETGIPKFQTCRSRENKAKARENG